MTVPTAKIKNMGKRQSFSGYANFGTLTTLMNPSSQERSRERRNLDALTTIFNLFCDQERHITEKALREVVRAGSCRLLDKEIEEFCDETHGKDRNVDEVVYDFTHVQKLAQRESFISKSWKKEADLGVIHQQIVKRRSGEQDDSDEDDEFEDVATNTYEQFFQSIKLLVDSYGNPGNPRIDVSVFEYNTTTVGESLKDNEYETVLKTVGHPAKGLLRPSAFLVKYADLSRKMGMHEVDLESHYVLEKCKDELELGESHARDRPQFRAQQLPQGRVPTMLQAYDEAAARCNCPASDIVEGPRVTEAQSLMKKAQTEAAAALRNGIADGAKAAAALALSAMLIAQPANADVASAVKDLTDAAYPIIGSLKKDTVAPLTRFTSF